MGPGTLVSNSNAITNETKWEREEERRRDARGSTACNSSHTVALHKRKDIGNRRPEITCQREGPGMGKARVTMLGMGRMVMMALAMREGVTKETEREMGETKKSWKRWWQWVTPALRCICWLEQCC